MWTVITLVPAGSSRIHPRIDGQWPLVVYLESPCIMVLVVDKIVLIDLHLGDYCIFIPACASDHPSMGEAEIPREGQIIRGTRRICHGCQWMGFSEIRD